MKKAAVIYFVLVILLMFSACGNSTLETAPHSTGVPSITEPEPVPLSTGVTAPDGVVLKDAAPITMEDGTELREFDFSGCDAVGIWADRQEFTFADGADPSMYVHIASWSPAYEKIALGLYNTETEIFYFQEYSGGSVADETLGFENLPGGTYHVIVINHSEEPLSYGLLRYSLD